MYSMFARLPAIVSTYFTFKPCMSKCFVYSVPLTKNSTMSLSETAECGLLGFEKRLFRYAKIGPELLEMADRGWYWRRGHGPGWSKLSRPPSAPKGISKWSG